MKTVLTISILFFIWTTNFFGQDCKKFKKGRFKIEGEEFKNLVVKRTIKKQIEKSNTHNITYKVIWKDSCNYELIVTKVIKADHLKIGDRIEVVIIETGEDYYKYQSTYKGQKLDGKMILY